jgi:two-component sensor histidine kinase/ActR/RegA family two-component response regulator
MTSHCLQVADYIMIVDDNAANLKLLEDMLLQGGHEAHCFLSGGMALAAAIKHPPNLFLLDINMPEMNGYDLCERLKSIHEFCEIPVIFLSALSEIEDKIKAFRCGAVDYISKPFQFEEVHARVETHLKLHGLQRALKRQNEQLETAVAARTIELSTANEQLRRALAVNITLLQEVHHRVNNNLQIICGILSMQLATAPDGNPFSERLKDTHSRVLAMAMVHGEIHRSETLADLNLGGYIEVLSDQVFGSYCDDPARIRLELSVEEIRLDLDHAIPCALILNELLSNSLKHAFSDGRPGVIRISLRKSHSGLIELVVADNGIGLPADFRLETNKSVGLNLVKILNHQLDGELLVTGEGGAKFTLIIKLPDADKLQATLPEITPSQ